LVSIRSRELGVEVPQIDLQVLYQELGLIRREIECHANERSKGHAESIERTRCIAWGGARVSAGLCRRLGPRRVRIGAGAVV